MFFFNPTNKNRKNIFKNLNLFFIETIFLLIVCSLLYEKIQLITLCKCFSGNLQIVKREILLGK
jgi:hypothetical protein